MRTVPLKTVLNSNLQGVRGVVDPTAPMIPVQLADYESVNHLCAVAVAAYRRMRAAGHHIETSGFVYRGSGSKTNHGYKQHLASLMASWLVQREAVEHLLPDFWTYAVIKVRKQADFVNYIYHTLESHHRTTQVWHALERMAVRDIKFHITMQSAPTL